MTINLSMPSQVSRSAPGQTRLSDKLTFNYIPRLKELLPRHAGVPGFEYLQVCVTNLMRVQDEGWKEVDNTFVYQIQGPKGAAAMKLVCRGSRTPGQGYDSGARMCYCDRSVEILTGLWINPKQHPEGSAPGESKVESESVSAAPETQTRGPLPTQQSVDQKATPKSTQKAAQGV